VSDTATQRHRTRKIERESKKIEKEIVVLAHR